VLTYAVVIAGISEVIYLGSKVFDDTLPIHIEVLLPAFVLGCVMKTSHEQEHEPGEARARHWVASAFMVLVGLSMPSMFGGSAAAAETATTVSAAQPMPGWGVIALHVLAVTVLSNIGKMYPALTYRGEADWRQRMAVAVAMWPRGEVGAGVLVLSISYGIGGPMTIVAMLSLTLNLVLTGLFILIVKRLLRGEAEGPSHPDLPEGLAA
jgi:Kef-type K+ transport system membrane component KefB